MKLKPTHGGILNIRSTGEGGRDVVKRLDGTIFGYIQRRLRGYMVQDADGNDKFMYERKHDAIAWVIWAAKQEVPA